MKYTQHISVNKTYPDSFHACNHSCSFSILALCKRSAVYFSVHIIPFCVSVCVYEYVCMFIYINFILQLPYKYTLCVTQAIQGSALYTKQLYLVNPKYALKYSIPNNSVTKAECSSNVKLAGTMLPAAGLVHKPFGIKMRHNYF